MKFIKHKLDIYIQKQKQNKYEVQEHEHIQTKINKLAV